MLKKKKLFTSVIAVLLIISGITAVAADGISVLVYSRTAGFRHRDAIDAGNAVLTTMAQEQGWRMSLTEDPAAFTKENLANYDVVLFNNTTKNVLPEPSQREALQSHIRAGGGFVGIHAASDTLYDWEWYGKLIGAYFRGHPPGMQVATVKVEDPEHPTMQGVASSFEIRDEWYWFRTNPREHVHVLATLDRTSHEDLIKYSNGDHEADHPIIWCQEYDGGRIWYTGLGHDGGPVQDPRFIAMLRQGIIWVANK